MSSHSLTAPTRRAVLAGLGLWPLAGCVVTGNPPLPHARVRAVHVDVSPLIAKGVSNWAARIRTIAEASVRDVFAGALVPGDRTAPEATLVIGQAWLSAYNGGGFMVAELDTATDWMEGYLTTSAAHDLPSLRRRVFVQVAAFDSGPWYAPDIDDRRIETLTRAWVASARGELTT